MNKGEQAAFPQARVVALAECGTHAIFAAADRRVHAIGDHAWPRQLVDRLEPGMLVLADRGFFSFALWRKASATGADLLWRVRTDQAGPEPAHLEDLADGSWLAELRRANRRGPHAEPMLVRVIDYTIDDGRENPDQPTGCSPPSSTPTRRPRPSWPPPTPSAGRSRCAFDELKTHQRGPRTVLRSKSPDLVLQEIWGHLCCHYAIRTLMAEAADHAGHDPDRVSFVAALRIARAVHRPAGRFSPLTSTTRRPRLAGLPAPAARADSTRPDGTAPHPASSNARCPSGTSNAPTTPLAPTPAPTHLHHPPT